MQACRIDERELAKILLGHEAFFDQLERSCLKSGTSKCVKSELNTGRILPQNRQLPRSFALGRSPDLKKQIAARLSQLAKDLELDEMVVVTWTHDPAPRHRSYELLAKAFG